MAIDSFQTDSGIRQELGSRLRKVRLARNLSQADLAAEAGIGRVTLQRIEEGQSASTTNLIRVLRALDLLEGLEQLVPPSAASPVDQLRRRGSERLRAGTPRRTRPRPEEEPESSERPWRWGDESEPRT